MLQFTRLLPMTSILLAATLSPMGISTASAVSGCTEAELKPVAEALRLGSDPCRTWVASLYGRILRVGAGSGSIWSTHTPRRTGLLVSARHVLGDTSTNVNQPIPGYFGPPMTDTTQQPEIFAFLPRQQGLGTQDKRNQSFRLFTRTLAPAEYRNHYEDILPKNDFVIGAITDRTLAPEQIGDGSVDTSPLQFSDPGRLTTRKPTFASPRAGDKVIVLGFPRDTGTFRFRGAMVYSVGTILTSREAGDLIRLDVNERRVRFDEQAEFAVDARSVAGMSGGGVFTASGQFLGPLVRGNDQAINGRYFSRVVRMDYLAEQFRQELLRAPPATRTKMTDFIEAAF